MGLSSRCWSDSSEAGGPDGRRRINIEARRNEGIQLRVENKLLPFAVAASNRRDCLLMDHAHAKGKTSGLRAEADPLHQSVRQQQQIVIQLHAGDRVMAGDSKRIEPAFVENRIVVPSVNVDQKAEQLVPSRLQRALEKIGRAVILPTPVGDLVSPP